MNLRMRRRDASLNRAQLNDANFVREFNFLEYWEIQRPGKTKHFSWVTGTPISVDNLMVLMRGGRARWKVENETFNTLKNQGYQFGRNFGCGEQHLSTVFAYLTMLTFLIDQIQQHCCDLFQRAQKKAKRKSCFWGKVRGLFLHYLIPDCEAFYSGIAFGLKPTPIPFNTS